MPLVLVTGGCRSGKSAYAQRLVEERFPATPKTYIATAPALDEEMRERIQRHRAERAGRGWETVEEQLQLTAAIAAVSGQPTLIDCLTVWTGNHMYHAEQAGRTIDDGFMTEEAGRLGEACVAHGGLVVAVTNEVGMGIVPDNRAARLFRDLAGRVNQAMAKAADEVYLLVSGIPMRIK